MDGDERDRLRRRALWGLLIGSHLAAAALSRGYLHLDEHVQVLGFIQWKLRLTPTESMPWELGEKMRPWLHPLIFFPLEWFSHHFLGMSPFTKTAFHRACVAALALFAIYRLQRGRDPRLLLLYATLFFFPFLDVRISSEMIGGWLFALGHALDEEKRTSERHAVVRWPGVGLLLGLAVVIRFQLWAMLGGVLLFHVVRRDARRLAWLGLGIAVAVIGGVLADRWGYGAFVFVPWNYVRQNLLLDKAAQFGVSPWYAYVPMLLSQTAYVRGAVMIFALLWQWGKRPLEKLSLMTAPFVVLHLLVSHKELRFLFPLAPLLPLMILSAWSDLTPERPWARSLAKAFVAINLALMVPLSVRDATPFMGLYAELRERSPGPAPTL